MSILENFGKVLVNIIECNFKKILPIWTRQYYFKYDFTFKAYAKYFISAIEFIA